MIKSGKILTFKTRSILNNEPKISNKSIDKETIKSNIAVFGRIGIFKNLTKYLANIAENKTAYRYF